MNDYIGATGNFPINDYIDYTSNINFIYTSNTSNYLNKRIDDIDIETSNISSNISDIYTQGLRNELWEVNPNNSKCLIKSRTYLDIPHTYIINSNIYGEIRFNTYFSFSATDDPINNYAVKIDNFGKLYVYHKYNLLQPTFPAGWYDIEGEVLGLKNQGILIDGSLAGLATFQSVATGQINLLQSLIATLKLQVDNLQYQIELLGFLTENEAYLIQGSQTFESLTQNMNNLANSMTRTYTNNLKVLRNVGIGLGIPVILGTITDYFNRQYYYNLASNFSNAYLPELTTDQRRILYSCNDIPYETNTSNYNYYTCNLGIIQGFINSNIITEQFIPTLKSNKIMIGNITNPNVAYQMELSGDLNLNMLYLNSTSLSSLLNQKQNNMSATQPIYITTANIGLNYDSSLTLNGSSLSVNKTATTPIVITGNDFSLSYDSSLTKVGNNLSVVKSASLPLSISASHNFSLNYDSTLELSGNNLKVAAATASKWIQSGNNIYYNNGNVGVGNINPQKKLHITHTNNDLIRIETDTNNVNQTSGIEFGIPAFASATRSKITSTTYSGDASDIQFYTSSAANGSTSRMTISSSGNVGIGVNPSYKLHIEDGSVFIGDSSIGNGSQIDNGYRLIFDSSYTATGANKCNKILLHKNDTAPTNIAGFGVEAQGLAYSVWTGAYHNFYTSATTSSGGFLSCSIYRDNFRFYGSTNAGAGGIISNGNAGASSYSYLSLANDTGNGILFLNSSTKTTDGGANTLTLRNDITGGDLRLSANLDTPFIYLKKSTGRVGISHNNPTSRFTIKATYDDVDSGICLDSSDNGTNNQYNFKIYPYVIGGGQVGVKMRIVNNTNTTLDALAIKHDGNTIFNYPVSFPVNVWNKSNDGYNRFYFGNTSRTYFSSGSGYEFRHSTDATIAVMSTIGQLGLDNDSPIGLLSLGNSSKVGSDGSLVIHKNSGGGSQRHMKMGFYTSTYDLTIGDWGNNNLPGTWVKTFYIAWNAPNTSLAVLSNGIVYSYYGFQSASDINLKTDIKTIENALWKVEQLRGVEYKHIITNDKNIGLIAQEVEHIIPEVVGYNDKTDTKTINYNGMIGLLVEAIKELKGALALAEGKINNLNKRIEALEK